MTVSHPNIVIHDILSRIDEPINISVTGIQPGQVITLHLIKKLNGERYLASKASYTADQGGIVDLSHQPPVQGSYQGVGQMGLFWSMEPVQLTEEMKCYIDDQYQPSAPYDELSPQVSVVLLEMDDIIVAHQAITRQWMGSDIEKLSIREEELIGSFFYHKDRKPRPAIIVLGGSEGGINEKTAALLASHGFSVLAVAYFGIEKRQAQLREIPLEYVEFAIHWIKGRREVQAGGIGIHGTSRGSELALWSATLFPDIIAAVSLNGSAVSFCGIVPWTEEPTLPPAWTYQGQSLPYLQPDNPIKLALECKEMWVNRRGNPLRLWHDGLSRNVELLEKATIPLEKMHGELLMVSGLEDESWDSATLSARGFNRKMQTHPSKRSKHLKYEGAGHYIGIPYLRVISTNPETRQQLAHASIDSWQETIKFYKQVLYK